jgi:hypothetical protein
MCRFGAEFLEGDIPGGANWNTVIYGGAFEGSCDCQECDYTHGFAAGGHERYRIQDDAGSMCILHAECDELVYGGTKYSTGPYKVQFNNYELATYDGSTQQAAYDLFRVDREGLPWDTRKATDMSSMFNGASSFAQSVAGFDTSAVTTTNSMFKDAAKFNDVLNNWDVTQVVDFGYMFLGSGMADFIFGR